MPPVLAQFAITLPSSVPLGGEATVSCEAQDAYGNRVTSFVGKLTLTGAGGLAIRGTSVTTPAFVAGRCTLAVIPTNLGTGVHLSGHEVGGAVTGLSNAFNVIPPWTPAVASGGSWAPGPDADGEWER